MRFKCTANFDFEAGLDSVEIVAEYDRARGVPPLSPSRTSDLYLLLLRV